MILETQPFLATSGRAVARAAGGRVVFVEGGAPDERLEVEIERTKKRHLEARMLRVLKPSPARVAPLCRHYGTCGGCVSQHVSADAQRTSKQHNLEQALERIGHVALENVRVEAPWSGSSFGYRTRARLASEAGRLGFRARRGNTVVDIDRCPVLSDALNQALDDLRADRIPQDAEIELLDVEGQVLAHARAARGSLPFPGAQLDDSLAADELMPIEVSAAVFSQSNAEGNRALLLDLRRRLESLAAARRIDILELFAGSGNISRVLLPYARRLVTGEISRPAVQLARANLSGTVAEVRRSEARTLTQALMSKGARFQLAFVDPPRSGLDRETIWGLLGLVESRLIYLSCDPQTFARDVGRLAQPGGFELEWVRLFDFYPHTDHAEVLAGLRRG